jgi:hypothetical protein
MRPLDCFAALAMTGGELARLFLGIALRMPRRARPSPVSALHSPRFAIMDR